MCIVQVMLRDSSRAGEFTCSVAIPLPSAIPSSVDRVHAIPFFAINFFRAVGPTIERYLTQSRNKKLALA